MIDALLPKVRRDILGLLFARPAQAFYQREIVRATDGGKGAVERELRSLVEAGILTREKRGNLVYYQADPSCPIFPEIHGIALKTAGLADVLREALARLEGIHLAFIFGSIAKGTADGRSDVDVLVVGDTPFPDVAAGLMAAEERLGRKVAPTVYSADEFTQRLAEKHGFLMHVLSEPKILLVGALDDLERVG